MELQNLPQITNDSEQGSWTYFGCGLKLDLLEGDSGWMPVWCRQQFEMLKLLFRLTVWAGPYCKQREAGRGPWNKVIDVQLPTLGLRSSRKRGIIFCVAVSSLCQRCYTLVVNYFQYTSGPVWVLTRARKTCSTIAYEHLGVRLPCSK